MAPRARRDSPHARLQSVAGELAADLLTASWVGRFPEDESMLYWLGEYVLVAIGVLVPFLLLCILGIVFWLTVRAIRSMMRGLKDAFAARPDFSRTHRNAIRRKAA
jgi:hypothetical protein